MADTFLMAAGIYSKHGTNFPCGIPTKCC